jgi:hypothetical protein
MAKRTLCTLGIRVGKDAVRSVMVTAKTMASAARPGAVSAGPMQVGPIEDPSCSREPSVLRQIAKLKATGVASPCVTDKRAGDKFDQLSRSRFSLM